MLAQTVEGDRAEVTAVGDLTHDGQRVLLRALPCSAGPVTAAHLRQALEHARFEGAQRVLVVGVAGFATEAVRAAQSLPLELIDGQQLAELSRMHLPELELERPPPPPRVPFTAGPQPLT
jgi:hypothetical protein